MNKKKIIGITITAVFIIGMVTTANAITINKKTLMDTAAKGKNKVASTAAKVVPLKVAAKLPVNWNLVYNDMQGLGYTKANDFTKWVRECSYKEGVAKFEHQIKTNPKMLTLTYVDPSTRQPIFDLSKIDDIPEMSVVEQEAKSAYIYDNIYYNGKETQGHVELADTSKQYKYTATEEELKKIWRNMAFEWVDASWNVDYSTSEKAAVSANKLRAAALKYLPVRSAYNGNLIMVNPDNMVQVNSSICFNTKNKIKQEAVLIIPREGFIYHEKDAGGVADDYLVKGVIRLRVLDPTKTNGYNYLTEVDFKNLKNNKGIKKGVWYDIPVTFKFSIDNNNQQSIPHVVINDFNPEFGSESPYSDAILCHKTGF